MKYFFHSKLNNSQILSFPISVYYSGYEKSILIDFIALLK